MYSPADRTFPHRFKADESYQVGNASMQPVACYLDIEGLIKIAKAHKVDAIHPGYGFLSENAQLSRRCKEEGIAFVGPTAETIEVRLLLKYSSSLPHAVSRGKPAAAGGAVCCVSPPAALASSHCVLRSDCCFSCDDHARRIVDARAWPRALGTLHRPGCTLDSRQSARTRRSLALQAGTPAGVCLSEREQGRTREHGLTGL